MRSINSFRISSLVFGAGIAAVLAFGATSALAAPGRYGGEQFFCGFHVSFESCDQCCGRYVATWWGPECYCGPDTKW
jgi:hypothetical protein